MDEFNQKTKKAGYQAPLSDEEAERSCVSLAFQDFSFYKNLISAGVKDSWFSSFETQTAWGVINELYKPPSTEITVFALQLYAQRELSQDLAVKTIDYIIEAGRLAIPESQLEKYRLRLLEAFQRRLLHREALIMASRAMDPTKTAEEALAKTQEGLNKIRNVSEPTEVVSAPRLASEATLFYKQRLLDKGNNQVMPYPWKAMNAMADGGMRKPEVTLLKGPTGIGKTQIGQLIWMELAEAGKVALAVSLEMPRRKLLARCIQQKTGISSSKMEVGDFGLWDKKVFGEINRFGTTKAYVVDDTRSTLQSIERAIEYIVQVQGKIDFLLLDYAQLLKEKAENDLLKHEKISTGIHDLTHQYNMHTIMVVRENRDGKINASSQYEYDAENIWAYKNDLATSQLPVLDKQGAATITIEKSRYGKTGEVVLWYNPLHIRLTDMDNKLPIPDQTMWK